MDITAEFVAKTLAGTLNYAARQASSPIFEDIVHGPCRDEVMLIVAMPGLKRFRMQVIEIAPAEGLDEEAGS